jgi:hypothetical protein
MVRRATLDTFLGSNAKMVTTQILSKTIIKEHHFMIYKSFCLNNALFTLKFLHRNRYCIVFVVQIFYIKSNSKSTKK